MGIGYSRLGLYIERKKKTREEISGKIKKDTMSRVINIMLVVLLIVVTVILLVSK